MSFVHRQVRIFVLPTLPRPFFMETVVGRVIKPAIEKHPPKWLWFSRYGEDRAGSAVDCDITQIPAAYANGDFFRSVRFRVRLDSDAAAAFESETMDLIGRAGFAASGFLDYPYTDDLAELRFFGGNRTPQRKEHRAELMAKYLDAGAQLFMDALEGPDVAGFFRSEPNPNALHGSSFEAMRHLFCNMTDAPTPVQARMAPDGRSVVLTSPTGERIIPI